MEQGIDTLIKLIYLFVLVLLLLLFYYYCLFVFFVFFIIIVFFIQTKYKLEINHQRAKYHNFALYYLSCHLYFYFF